MHVEYFSSTATRPLQAGTGMWSSASSMSSARFGVAAGVLNQRVYVVGGTTQEDRRIRSKRTTRCRGRGRPTLQPAVPLATMPTPRESLAAVVVGTQLYALGGHTTGGAAVATVEAYDGTTNTWTTKASLPSARAALGAAVIGNVIYAVGGGEAGAELNTLEAYDVGTEHLDLARAHADAAPLSGRRRRQRALVCDRRRQCRHGRGVRSQHQHVDHEGASANASRRSVGGRSHRRFDLCWWEDSDASVSIRASSKVYNPATDSWSTLASMLTARDEAAIGVLDGRLFVAGGKDGAQSGQQPGRDARGVQAT